MGRYVIVEVVYRVADEGGAGTGHADQLRQRAITSSKLHELAVVRALKTSLTLMLASMARLSTSSVSSVRFTLG